MRRTAGMVSIAGFLILAACQTQPGDKFTTTSLGGVSFVPLTREVREE